MHEPSRPALVERVGDMPDAPKAVAGQHPPPSMVMTAWEEVLLQDNERDLLQQREAVGREADLPRGDLCDRLVFHVRATIRQEFCVATSENRIVELLLTEEM
jgi:hypothetical protein